MANTSITSVDPVLKQIYKDSVYNDLTYKRQPLFGMLSKFEGFGGRNMPVPLQYGNPQGRSKTFTTAQSNATAVSMEDFVMTRVNDYAVAYIDGEAIEATVGDKMAFVKALKAVTDGAINQLSNSIETKLFRTGTGSLGTISAVSTTSMTLTQIEEITAFEVGMSLVASEGTSGSDGDALIDSGNAGTVSGVNRTTGVLTSATNWGTSISGIAADDYLYIEGDAKNGGSSLTAIAGLAAWLPSSTPSGSFFGVTRSTDSRLFGMYHDGSGGDPIEEALIYGQSKSATQGGAPDCVAVHHAQYRRLIVELGAKKEYQVVNASSAKGTVANVGYKAVVVDGDHGPLSVVACNKCQANIAWVLDKSTWTLASLGKAVKFISDDGLKMLRQASADGIELRLRFRGNLFSTRQFIIATLHYQLQAKK